MNSSILSKRAQIYRELSQRKNIPDVAWIGFMVDLLHVVHTGKMLDDASYAYDDQTGALVEEQDASLQKTIPSSSLRGAVHDAYVSGYQRLSDMMKHLLPQQYEGISNILAETSNWDLSSPRLTMALLSCCGQPLETLRDQVKEQWIRSDCWPDQ